MLLRALLKPFGGPCTVSGSEVCPAEEHCLLGRIATDHLNGCLVQLSSRCLQRPHTEIGSTAHPRQLQ